MLDYQIPQRKPDCTHCVALEKRVHDLEVELAAVRSADQQIITAQMEIERLGYEQENERLRQRIRILEHNQEMCRGYDTDRTHNQH